MNAPDTLGPTAYLTENGYVVCRCCKLDTWAGERLGAIAGPVLYADDETKCELCGEKLKKCYEQLRRLYII